MLELRNDPAANGVELIGSVVLLLLLVAIVLVVVVGVVGHAGDSDSGHGLLSGGSKRGSQSELGKFCAVRQTTFRVCTPPGPHFTEHYVQKKTNKGPPKTRGTIEQPTFYIL